MNRRNEEGMATLEIVLALPVLIMVALFVVGLGRMAEARSIVDAAAFDAARAASLERNVGAAQAVGHDAAKASIGTTGVACTGLTIQVDVSQYTVGGHVTATVACTGLVRTRPSPRQQLSQLNDGEPNEVAEPQRTRRSCTHVCDLDDSTLTDLCRSCHRRRIRTIGETSSIRVSRIDRTNCGRLPQ